MGSGLVALPRTATGLPTTQPVRNTRSWLPTIKRHRSFGVRSSSSSSKAARSTQRAPSSTPKVSVPAAEPTNNPGAGVTRIFTGNSGSLTSPVRGPTTKAETPSRSVSLSSSPARNGRGSSKRRRADLVRNQSTASTRSRDDSASISSARAVATSTAGGARKGTVGITSAPTTIARGEKIDAPTHHVHINQRSSTRL